MKVGDRVKVKLTNYFEDIDEDDVKAEYLALRGCIGTITAISGVGPSPVEVTFLKEREGTMNDYDFGERELIKTGSENVWKGKK